MRTARQVTEELIQLSLTDDIAQVDLFAEDAVHELPFSPTGTPLRFTRAEMRAAMSAPGPARVTDRELVRIDLTESADGGTVLAEYAITGTLAATGEPVSMDGVMAVTARDGLIIRSRNYMNPDALRRIGTPSN